LGKKIGEGEQSNQTTSRLGFPFFFSAGQNDDFFGQIALFQALF
jgi:hypothetical protein